MNHLVNNAFKLVKANGPEILTALGVGGVISTAVLAGKAAIKANKIIEHDEYDNARSKTAETKKAKLKRNVALTWKTYIPPVASGVVTIGAIVLSHKTGSRRTAAAVTAYSLSENAFSEYKNKAAEVIGEGKERRMRDELAQERVNANPVSGKQVLVVGKGNVLCYDARSCRYFRSSMEELQRAANDINFQLNHERYMSLSEFYILIGLPITKESVYVGWNLDRGLMELDITATISENDEPCLSMDFNYCTPLHDDPNDFPICEGG